MKFRLFVKFHFPFLLSRVFEGALLELRDLFAAHTFTLQNIFWENFSDPLLLSSLNLF